MYKAYSDYVMIPKLWNSRPFLDHSVRMGEEKQDHKS